jgi:kynurenine formamidase
MQHSLYRIVGQESEEGLEHEVRETAPVIGDLATHEQRAGREGSLRFYDLSHPFGHDAPLWPYFPDVKIERFHYHAKSGVLSQQITTFMHCTTHTDAPAHVIEGTRFIDEVPLASYFGSGVVVSIPKEKWEVVTAADLEAARPEIRPGDIVLVNTGWHHHYGDNRKYFVESPGTYKEAGEWLVERGVKGFGIDCQALDHPLGTAIGAQPNGPLVPSALTEYRELTGHEATEDFPDWEPCHRALLGNGIVGFENVGGQLDEVTGMRVTIAAFPWRWQKGDGCIVRLVAIVDPSGEYRFETGS